VNRVAEPVSAYEANVSTIGNGPVLRSGSPIWVRAGDVRFGMAMVFESTEHYRAYNLQAHGNQALARTIHGLLGDVTAGRDAGQILAAMKMAAEWLVGGVS